MRSEITRTLLSLVLLAISMTAMAADVPVSGHIPSSTWTPANTYLVTDNLYVDAGVTLTIQPGVKVKFGDNVGFWVDGTLDARGTSAAGITFTGSTESVDWWRAIFVQNAGAAILEYCTVVYGGYAENVIIRKTGSGALTLKNSTIGYSDDIGLQIYSNTGALTLANNTYRNNSRGILIGINTSYDDATSDFTANSSYDAFFEGGTVTRAVTWSLKKNYSIFLSDNLTIGAGATFTIKPGTVVKFGDNVGLWVDGTLDARGTAAERIYLTDLRDDTVGGDANKDGTATAPAADWWRAILVQNAGTALIENSVIRYGGYAEGLNIRKTGTGNLTIKNSTVSNARTDGLRIESSTGTHTLENSIFTANGSSGLVLSNSLAGVTGCTFSNNAWGLAQTVGSFIDYSVNSFSGNTSASVWVGGGTMGNDVLWTKGGGTDEFALYLNDNVTVDTGKTLTVRPGVKVKFGDNVGLWVDGSLDARGTSGAGITFTGSTESVDWWRAILVRNAGTATLEYCTVVYGGYAENVIIHKTGSGALTLKNSTIGYSDDIGVQIYSNTGPLTLANNTYRNNSRGIWIGLNTSYDDATSDFVANSSYDAFFEGGTMTGAVTWSLKKNYSIFLSGDLTIGAGATLTIKPGAVVKFGDNVGLWVDGTLDARGTAAERIYFTDLRDDTVGGDANKDGTTAAPAADWWRAILVQNAGTAVTDNCVIRYGGYAEGLNIRKTGTGNLTIKNSTVSNARTDGLRIESSTGTHTLENSIFTANASSGLVLSNSLAGVTGCTFSNNAWGLAQTVGSFIDYNANSFNGNTSASVWVGGGTMGNDVLWTKGGGTDEFALYLSDDVTVDTGKTLTVRPGVKVKFGDNVGLWVDGSLDARGTSGAGITFTGSTESVDWWRAILVRNAGAASLEYCTVVYGGYAENVIIRKTGSGALTLKNSTIGYSDDIGLQIYSNTGPLTLANNTYRNNSRGIWIGLNTSYDDATSDFTANSSYDAFFEGGTMGANVTWNLKKNYSIFLSGDLTIGAGATLTIKPGTVVKFADNVGLWVDGTLDARGTSAAGITFTGSTESVDWWRAIFVRNAGTATLEYCTVVYGGYAENVIIHKTGSGALTLKNSTIGYSDDIGIYLDSAGAVSLNATKVTANARGIYVEKPPAALTIVNCQILGNTTFGLFNNSLTDVDARHNYWGDSSGPYNDPKNKSGKGNAVSAHVLFEPWNASDAVSHISAPVLSGTIMSGDALYFKGLQPEGGIFGYQWTLGAGRTSSLKDPGLVNFSNSGTTDATASVTFALIDSTGAVDPNPDSRTFTVKPAGAGVPDLKTSAVLIPPSLNAGQSYDISYTVTNIGDGPAGATWQDSIYLSSDAYLDDRDTLLGSVSLARNLAPGASYQGKITIRVPAATGKFNLLACADSGWKLYERHRLNNDMSAETSVGVENLASGVTRSGSIPANGGPQYLGVNVEAGKNLALRFTGKVTVYLRFGAFPSIAEYDYRQHFSEGGSITVSGATPGKWYVMVVPDPGEGAVDYTIKAEVGELILSGVSPSKVGNAAEIVLTLTGAGFAGRATVELVNPAGSTLPARSASVDSPSMITATFTAGTVPAAVYGVRLTLPGKGTAELGAALTVVSGGTPKFTAKLILPERFGYHQLATVYAEYGNTGDAPMEAPILMLKPTQKGKAGAILTLDKTRLSAGFWTSVMPDGFANQVQFLASGAIPGLLQPGESRRVAIYYAGWQQPWDSSYPPFDWGLGVLAADNTTAINWASMKNEVRPPHIAAEVWDVIWPNFAAQIGTTWGGYVRTLSANAVNLYRLGQRVEAIDQLLGFSLLRADSLNPVHVLAAGVDGVVQAPGLGLSLERVYTQPISRRYELGPLGRGWAHSWQISIKKESDGTVAMSDMTGRRRLFQPDSRYAGQYVSRPGDLGSLSTESGGSFALREADGKILRFNSDGRLLSVENANGNRITCEYTGGLLTRLVHSSGQSLAIGYNGSGRITSVTDKDGRATNFTYDASGEHLLTAAIYKGTSATYAYVTGQGAAREHALAQITLTGELNQYFTYDSQGRLASTYRDGNAAKVTFSYDERGTVTVGNALGNANRLFFDYTGRLAKAENGLGQAISLEYDELGSLKKVIDPAGSSSTSEFDGKGNLVGVTDALHNKTKWTYAPTFNRLASMSDAKGNTTPHTYDSKGNLIAITQPDGSRETWTYDAAGNPITWTNRRGNAISFTFDAAGRVTRKILPGGSRVDYTYDSRGNLTQTVDGTGTTTYTYDAKDRLVRIDYPNGRLLSLTYDALGRRTTSLDQLGNQINYQYDSVGRLERLTGNSGAEIVRYTYNPAGQLSSKILGNGVNTAYEYDAAGRLVRLENKKGDGSTVSSFKYTYDTRGRRTTMDTHYGTWFYQYDDLGQLTKAILTSRDGRVTNQDIAYEYDALGNRTKAVVNGTASAHTTNNLNQYVTAGNQSYTYDADGNLVQESGPGGTTSYVYDQENRLVSVTKGGKTWAYTYDALGNRASMTEDGILTTYMIDPAGPGNVAGEYNASGTLIARYVHGMGLVGRLGQGGSLDYYTSDAMGNTSELVGSSGAVRNSYAYSPFGEVLLDVSTVGNRFTYNGMSGAIAEGNGLFHMRARHYSPGVGRFLQADPIGLAGGINCYSYALNNAVSHSDPSGLMGVVEMIMASGRAWEFLEVVQPILTPHVSDLVLTVALKGDLAKSISLAVHAVSKTAVADCLKIAGINIPTAEVAAAGTAATTSIFFTPVSQVGAVPLVAAGIVSFTGGYIIGTVVDTYFPNNPVSSFFSGFFGWYYGVSDTVSRGTAGSQDPNQKLGPGGGGTKNAINPDGTFAYRIDFENDKTATAPAQIVSISDALSPSLDWGSFELTEVGFGDHLIPIPAGTRNFEYTEPMTYNGKALAVTVKVTLDAAGRLTAWFTTNDPETGLPPEVLYGFLPPEDGSGRGQGHISYLIRPKAGLADGLEVRNVATIVFDFSTSIDTNQVDPHDKSKGTDPAKEAMVTVDKTPPTSAVAALPATSAASFQVRWAGSDAVAGVARYTIYVQDNGGAFTPWLKNTTTTSALYTGTAGHTYGFYSIATDNAGNMERSKSAADTSTRIGAPSYLYFPRLVHTAAEWTGFAVANPTQQTVQLSFQAYADNGTPMTGSGMTNPRSQDVGAGKQLAQLAFQVFSFDAGQNLSGGWTKVTTSIAGLPGFFLALDPSLNTMDGADVSDRLLQDFIIPEVQQAELSLVNPDSAQTAAVTLRLLSDAGLELGTVTRSIPPNGRFSSPVSALFSSALLSLGGTLRVTSTLGLAAVEMFGVPGSYQAALNPLETAGGSKLLFSPQYAVGGGWKTKLVLVNLENTATVVRLSLIGGNASPIGTTAVLVIPARGRLVVSDPILLGVSGSGNLVEGYIRVTSDTTRVAGYVRFGDSGDAQFQTALPLVFTGRNQLIYSQLAQNETYFTGVAIINANAQAANVTISVFNTDGVQVGTKTVRIGAGERVSQLLPQLIPGLPELGGGYFRVNSDQPVFSFAVFGTNTLSVLSAVPAQQVPVP